MAAPSIYKELGLEGPCTSPLFAGSLYDSCAILNKSALNVNTIEAEVAFVLDRSLPPLEGGKQRNRVERRNFTEELGFRLLRPPFQDLQPRIHRQQLGYVAVFDRAIDLT